MNQACRPVEPTIGSMSTDALSDARRGARLDFRQ
jgi:hypothetical protein